MTNGEVKRWLSFRGYGFIEAEGYDEDVFVHFSEITNGNSLEEGQQVEFDVEENPKGPKATNLKIVE